MQQKYATYIVFESSAGHKQLFDDLIDKAIHTVMADNISTFFSQKLHGNQEDEMAITIISV